VLLVILKKKIFVFVVFHEKKYVLRLALPLKIFSVLAFSSDHMLYSFHDAFFRNVGPY